MRSAITLRLVLGVFFGGGVEIKRVSITNGRKKYTVLRTEEEKWTEGQRNSLDDASVGGGHIFMASWMPLFSAAPKP
jgi:hypothetical protein